MAFKINIGEKSGKTYKLEANAPGLIDKELGDKIDGKEIKNDLEGYEFEITGTSDNAGFPSLKEVPGQVLRGVLLTYPKGLRLRKKVRGKVISESIVQINLKVVKEGKRPLAEIFAPVEKPAEKPTETITQ